MKYIKILFAVTLFFTLSTAFTNAIAKDTIDAADFVDQASAKNIAEIEAGKLALEKSSSTEVKNFAQQMIDDHSAANKSLTDLAHRKNLKVATDAELMNKAKAFILKQRSGESFDEAYIKNQIKAHKDTIALFNKAAKSNDSDIAAFANLTLPKLEHHSLMAQQLITVVAKK